MSQVVAAVTAADSRVTDVSAEKSTSGLSTGWIVDVVLDGADPVSSDELGEMLLAVRHAGDRDPGHVHLFATDASGVSFDLATPAEALGLRYTDVGAGIGVVRSAIDEALGTGE